MTPRLSECLRVELHKVSRPSPLRRTARGIAAWAANPNQTTLWRISDGAVLMRFAGAAPEEGVGAIRFTPDWTRLVTTGYLPFVDPDGLWDQKGVIRFWRVADGMLRQVYDARTGLGVTSPVAWSPDGTRFAYGTYEGTAVVARTPAADSTSVGRTPRRVIPLENFECLHLPGTNSLFTRWGYSRASSQHPATGVWASFCQRVDELVKGPCRAKNFTGSSRLPSSVTDKPEALEEHPTPLPSYL